MTIRVEVHKVIESMITLIIEVAEEVLREEGHQDKARIKIEVAQVYMLFLT
jgi:hypothetical protein